MIYPIVLHKDKDSDYGATVPDLPGCFSAGATLDEALEMNREQARAAAAAGDGVVRFVARATRLPDDAASIVRAPGERDVRDDLAVDAA